MDRWEAAVWLGPITVGAFMLWLISRGITMIGPLFSWLILVCGISWLVFCWVMACEEGE
jgi:hypothetical protein